MNTTDRAMLEVADNIKILNGIGKITVKVITKFSHGEIIVYRRIEFNWFDMN